MNNGLWARYYDDEPADKWPLDSKAAETFLRRCTRFASNHEAFAILCVLEVLCKYAGRKK